MAAARTVYIHNEMVVQRGKARGEMEERNHFLKESNPPCREQLSTDTQSCWHWLEYCALSPHDSSSYGTDTDCNL